MSDQNQIIEVIIKRIDDVEKTLSDKLDSYNKEFLNFKYDTKSDFDKINLKLDKHDSEIKNINDRLNLPWNKKIFELFATSSIYSIGAILGICIFAILINSFGGNIGNLIKSVLSAIVGI